MADENKNDKNEAQKKEDKKKYTECVQCREGKSPHPHGYQI